jgi:hypothetical protein
MDHDMWMLEWRIDQVATSSSSIPIMLLASSIQSSTIEEVANESIKNGAFQLDKDLQVNTIGLTSIQACGLRTLLILKLNWPHLIPLCRAFWVIFKVTIIFGRS